jgi:gliding motility-associated-like protein
VNATGTITVFPSFTFNPLSDTTRVCGTSTTLNAGPGFASYSWNTTATIQTIPATASGFYKVTVTNAAGCTASDSTYLSLVNANIINNDTTICKGSSITLSIDSLFPGRTVCNANQLPASLRNGLVGYWPFCGNANDESGNGNNGVVNGATLTTDRLGSANSAYSFDGVNDFIQMPNRSISGSFTISCWYKMPTYNINTLGANDFIFFANHSGVNDNNRNVLVGYRNFGSEYGHSTYVKGGSGSMIGYYALNQIPVANKWHHFVCQFTNGVSVKMYLDNVLFYTNNTVVSNTTLPSLPMFFGIGIPTQFNFYKGELDDVSIWNRVLTEQEILQLYNSTSSVTWSPTGATTNSITVSPTQTTTYYVTVTDGITTCTDSVKVTVSTVDTSLTVLDPLQLCATGGQVRMQAGVASSYQWLLNGSPIVNATLQTYSATQSGVYRVVVTNSLNCRDTSRAVTITVNPTPTVNSVNNTTVCSGATVSSITFSGSVAGTVYSWSNNTPSIGLATSGTGNLPTFTAVNTTTAPVTATITVTPSFTNGGLTCTGTPRTFTITVNPNPSALINPNAQTICSGAALTPISISGPVAGTIFTWTRDNASTVTGVSASGTGDINGSLTNTTNAPILVTFTITPAFTNAGVTCTGTAITSVVLVNPLPTVNSTPNAQTICSGNAITPINMTGVVTGTVYSWTRDNTTTITGIGASGTGNIGGSLTNTTNTPITVTFTFTPTANGCVGIPSVARVLVNPAPTMIATPSNQAICSGGTINPIVMTGGVIGTVFNWTRDNVSSVPGIPANGAGNISGTLTNNSAVPVLVTFTITPTANACQGAATTATVLVNPKPTGTITSSSTIICEGSSVTLTATGGSTYQWFLDGQPVSGATGATLNAVQAGTYTVQLISSAGCTTQVTNSITLTSIARPTAAFTFDKYCAGVSTQFTDLSTIAASGSVTYAWNFGPGATSTLQNPQYTFTTPGAYLVSLTVTPTACPSLTSVATRLVQVQSAPANQRYPSVNAVEGRGLQLQARVITNATYNWSPSQGLNRVDIRTPIFNYNQEQQYLITILSPEGCVIRDTLLVRLFKQVDILLPTGFSPNGDGHNDQLIPRLVGIDKLKYFRVYDRWGQLLFQTDQIGKGWDGTFKGVKQPLETYAWVAEGVAVDGSVIKRSGTSILLR